MVTAGMTPPRSRRKSLMPKVSTPDDALAEAAAPWLIAVMASLVIHRKSPSRRLVLDRRARGVDVRSLRDDRGRQSTQSCRLFHLVSSDVCKKGLSSRPLGCANHRGASR